MYVELPYTSHGTVCQPAYVYVEHFVLGQLPLREKISFANSVATRRISLRKSYA